MKISAVIPAYNSAKFIAEAVNSINSQTTPIDEIIIVDDGSTDNTEQVVADLPGNIVYHKQPNQGPSVARNQGIEIAKGDWIAFLDADDQWTPEKINLQVDALNNNSSLCLIAGDMTEINTEDKIIVSSVLAKHNLLETFKEIAGKPIPNALAKLIKKNFIPTGTVLVKRSTLMEAGLFNPKIRFGEDLELWAKIAAKNPIASLPKVLMLRRQHGGNATQASENMHQDLIKVMESLRQHIRIELKAQGINSDQSVADSYWELGYWYFSTGEIIKARYAFLNSLKQEWCVRSVIYFLATLLPCNMVIKLRFIKQKFT